MSLIQPHEHESVMQARVDRVISRAKQRKFDQYAAAPEAYAAEVLHVRWWSKQIEIGQSVVNNRRTAVYSGHSTGKTHGIGGLVQWHFDCFDPSITLTTAPNWNSIHDLLWGEIKVQRPESAPGRLLDIRLESGPMHYAKGHNAESSAGFQGRHEQRQLIVIDEAQGAPGYIWEASNAMMTSPDCRILVSGNPTETSGQFYDLLEDPDWNVINISCLDHPNILAELSGQPPPYPKAVSLTWVREMLDEHCQRVSDTDINADCFEFPVGSGEWYRPDDVFRPRVLGLSPRQASNSVFGESALKLARLSVMTWQETSWFEIGADIARFGDDLTVIYVRRGPVVIARYSYAKQDTMATTGRIVQIVHDISEQYGIERSAITLNVDDTGLGGGVTDRLRELGYTVNAINFGERAVRTDEYYNRGSELWFNLARRAHKMQLDLSRLPNDVHRKLSAELRARRYRTQSDKTLRVESKDDVKKRLKRSPDDADALILAFAGNQPVPQAAVSQMAQAEPGRFGHADDLTGSRWKRSLG